MISLPSDNYYTGVNCGSPSSLSNGSVTVGLTTFNSLAGYGCDDGFLLDPPSQEIRSCTANRVWSGPDPTCNCTYLLLQVMLLLF